MEPGAVVVQELVKKYGKIRAVDQISFRVEPGEIFGLLGPNGAGKTTTIRMLLTLVKPNSGQASLFGVDVSRNPEQVRAMAGYVPQDVSVDGELTGYENILLYAKLFGVRGAERAQRIREILAYLDLEERAQDLVKTYSGGMMRRLEIAQSLVNRPRVRFLDEPSLGLDPNAKRMIWGLINRLRDEFGATIFLTTHDMNEADTLCDRIGIMDRGRLVTLGEPEQLKSKVGGDVLSLRSPTPGARGKLEAMGYSVRSEPGDERLEIAVANGESLIPRLLETLQAGGVEVETVSLQKSTLDEVFFHYTGARIEEGETWKATRRTRRVFRRLGK